MSEPILNRRQSLKALGGAAALGVLGGITSTFAEEAGDAPAKAEVQLVGGWQTISTGNKHIPVVSHKVDGEVAIITAEVKHPMNEAHHISDIRLYDEDRVELTRLVLDPDISVGIATFTLKAKAGTKLYCVSDCNLHGLWMKEFTL